jgi:hypothetical protein
MTPSNTPSHSPSATDDCGDCQWVWVVNNWILVNNSCTGGCTCIGQQPATHPPDSQTTKCV